MGEVLAPSPSSQASTTPATPCRPSSALRGGGGYTLPLDERGAVEPHPAPVAMCASSPRMRWGFAPWHTGRAAGSTSPRRDYAAGSGGGYGETWL